MLHYIVDGYNVIKAESSPINEGTLENRRDTLIKLINQKSPQGSATNKITVVFDGRSENPFSGEGYNRQTNGTVEILYSENASADRIIEKVVNEASNPAEIVVVTDDRGIKIKLSYTGAAFLPSELFLRRLYNNPKKASAPADNDHAEAINKELKRKWLSNER